MQGCPESEAEADDETDDKAEEKEPSDDEMEEDESGHGNEEMDQDNIDTDMMLVTGADEPEGEASGIEDLPTLQALIQKAVPQLIRLARVQTR